MSMPSDMTSDISDALQKTGGKPLASARDIVRNLTVEQVGLAAATAVAFLGVAVIGPRILQLRQPPSLTERARFSAREGRRRAQNVNAQARKRLRRLGGGTIRA